MIRLLYLWLLLPFAALSATPASDFSARCAASGVVLCNGLDSSGDLTANSASIQTAYDGSTQGAIDTVQKASGAGSLRFKMRGGVSTANIGGAWSTPLGDSFGAGETIYVQVRFRYSRNVLAYNTSYWDSSLKLTNIHGASSTCQNSEFTTVTGARSAGQLIESYTQCGNGFPTNVTTNALLSSCPGDCLIQQGSQIADGTNVGYNCHYQSQSTGDGNGDGCLVIEPEIWYTLYQEIALGTRGGSNTSYRAYIAREGGVYKQFHRVDGINWGGSGDATFSVGRLETYMTEISGSAPADSYIWYDEFIVSTQAIAVPVGTPPKKPTSVAAP